VATTLVAHDEPPARRHREPFAMARAERHRRVCRLFVQRGQLLCGRDRQPGRRRFGTGRFGTGGDHLTTVATTRAKYTTVILGAGIRFVTLGLVIDVIGLDADDTLWHSQNHYDEAEHGAAVLLAEWTDSETLADRLLEVERRNIGHYGFGAKSFTLSLIETAIAVSDGAVGPDTISGLIEIGRSLLQHPVELIDGAVEAITALTDDHHLVVVTKGDLLHQERKLEESGLREAFDDIHIVSEKTIDTYRHIAGLHQIEPASMLMVGNSLPSDVLPAQAAGLHAVHVPYHLLWAYEHHEPAVDDDEIPTIESLHQLPDHVAELKRSP